MSNHMTTALNFPDLQAMAAEILGIDPDAVQLDKSFARDLAADSLDLVELIAAVEDKYEVELPEETLEGMKNVGDLWKFLEEKQAEKAGA
ncbi:MAG: acyl carrier protein [Chloroflexota bacterium]